MVSQPNRRAAWVGYSARMASHSFLLQGPLGDYVDRLAGQESEAQKGLTQVTMKLAEGEMKSSPEAGRTLAMLVRLIGAKRAFEIGTFTGYSALWIAPALASGGRLVCCDVSEEWPAMGRPFWEQAGVADRIELRVGPASQSMREMAQRGDAGAFDFGFIDADKTGYPDYYERGLELLRPGGLMVFDNVLRRGRVADTDNQEPDTLAIRQVNDRAFADERVDAAMLLLGDGLLLVRKRD